TWLYTRDRGIEFALETEDAQPVVRIAETLVEEGLLSWADLNWLDGSVGVPDGESGLLLRGEAALPEEDAEVE
ncbi:MAG: hypothetical protein KDD47_21610, partial [Acidobacteria bacterium]|nr:hypothetical protein [Acidobacteriota bacterium]